MSVSVNDLYGLRIKKDFNWLSSIPSKSITRAFIRKFYNGIPDYIYGNDLTSDGVLRSNNGNCFEIGAYLMTRHAISNTGREAEYTIVCQSRGLDLLVKKNNKIILAEESKTYCDSTMLRRYFADLENLHLKEGVTKFMIVSAQDASKDGSFEEMQKNTCRKIKAVSNRNIVNNKHILYRDKRNSCRNISDPDFFQTMPYSKIDNIIECICGLI